MDVHTRLHLTVYITRFGTRDDTATLLDDGMHQFYEIDNDVIWKRLWTFVIEIDEKPENVCFLLHHI
jgi:hypothetical protein